MTPIYQKHKAEPKIDKAMKTEQKPSLKFKRVFNPDGLKFDSDAYNVPRKVVYRDINGGVRFERDVFAPESWPQTTVNHVASMYFYTDDNTDTRENSVIQMVNRVVDTIAQWGLSDGYFDNRNKYTLPNRQLSRR